MKLICRKGQFYWLPDVALENASPIAGPFPTREAAFMHHLMEQEAKLTEGQRAVWAILYDASRNWWSAHPHPGSSSAEIDLLATLFTIMNGVQSGMNAEFLCRMAAGAEWRAWHVRVKEATQLEVFVRA